MADNTPLAEAIRRINASNPGVRLYATNLTAKRASGQSVIEDLADKGLAWPEGKVGPDERPRRWLVSEEAFPLLLAQAKSARPGKPPGERATLDAVQIGDFARALAQEPDPATRVRQALAKATGWDHSVLDQVEYVIIPVRPRQPMQKVEGSNSDK